jgi:hypothetical protein
MPKKSKIIRELHLEEMLVIDIGCSGGFGRLWGSFAEKFRGIGFDPNVVEIERLKAIGTLRGVHYIPAFVAPPADDDVRVERGGRLPWTRNPWERLAVAAAGKNREGSAEPIGADEAAALNRWTKTTLADRDKPVVLQAFLEQSGVERVDFIKIDVDGDDFAILRSLRDYLGRWRVLGVMVEVNFFGGGDPTENSFHNMDRFLRECGFDLFDLSVRRYAHAALPGPFPYGAPGPSTFGRPLQGDALYLRDPGADVPGREPFSTQELLKIAAIAVAHGLPDFAADVLVGHPELASVVDTGEILDLLAALAQGSDGEALSYADYMEDFVRETSHPGSGRGFFYGPAPEAKLRARVAALEDERIALVERNAALEVLARDRDAMLASRSWRLTMPLRRLAWRLFRR